MSEAPEIWDLPTNAVAFRRGVTHMFSSVMSYVLAATFMGIGALAHDSGLGLDWVVISTALVWAGPAQLILISTLASGASIVQAALAVTLSAIRLLPMVVSLLPLLRHRDTRTIELALPSHFTAVTFWVESLRAIPQVPRERRIAFCNGFGIGLVVTSTIATAMGHVLSDQLPPQLSSGILMLTPIVFLLSMVEAAKTARDWLALVLGLIAMPLVMQLDTGVDLLIVGLVAGSMAYGAGRILRARREADTMHRGDAP